MGLIPRIMACGSSHNSTLKLYAAGLILRIVSVPGMTFFRGISNLLTFITV